jgi:hypothetical protein
VNEEAVERAFSEGRILRTHILRPTWHFVAARDIRWMLDLSAPRVHAFNRYMYRREGIDKELASKCARLLREVLQGGEQLTRAEILDWFGRNGVAASGVRLAYILMWAELEALICSGARRGKQHTYALLDERATAEQETALLEAFTGKYGGPLADIAQLIGTVKGVERVPITHGIRDGTGTLAIPGVLEAEMTPFHDQQGRVTTLRDSVFSTVPGSPAYVGKASHHRVHLPQYGMTWEYADRNAIQSDWLMYAACLASETPTGSGGRV